MKILYFAIDLSACGFYRLRQPAYWLAQAGAEVREFSLKDWSAISQTNTALLRWADVIVVGRLLSSEVFLTLRDYNPEALIVYDLDDNFFDLPEENQARRSVDAITQENVRGILYQADLITVTTNHLAEQVMPWNDNVAVLPNCVDPIFLKWPRHTKDHLRVGWAGSATHSRDIIPAVLGLKAALEKWNQRKNVTPAVATFMGYLGFEASKQFEQCYWQQPVTMDQYYPKLHGLGLDIGLAPVRPHPFNESKSDIKFQEYSVVCGAPTIASAVGPYRDSIKNEETGLLIKNHEDPQEWAAKIEWLLEDQVMRQRLVENARDWIRINREPREWAEATLELYKRNAKTPRIETRSEYEKEKEKNILKKPTLTMGILSYCPAPDERFECLQRCLPVILARAHAERAEVKVVIFSQGSCAEAVEFIWHEAEVAIARGLNVEALESPVNEGIPAINKIFENNDADYFMKIDDDVIPPPGFVDKMLEVYTELETAKRPIGMLSLDPRWGNETFGTRENMKCVSACEITSGGHWVYWLQPNSTAVGMCRLESASSYKKSGGHPIELMYGTDQIMADRFTGAGYINAHVVPTLSLRPGGPQLPTPLLHLGPSSDASRAMKRAVLQKMTALREEDETASEHDVGFVAWKEEEIHEEHEAHEKIKIDSCP